MTIVSLKAGQIQGVRHDLEKTIKVEVDRTIEDIRSDEFDAVLLPGGAVNADRMRTVPEVQGFLRAMQGPASPSPPSATLPGSWCRRGWCAIGR